MSAHTTFSGFVACALGYQEHSDRWPYGCMASMIYWSGAINLGLVVC